MTTTKQAASPSTSSSPANAYPFYAPRFWHGMNLPDFLRLMAKHRFRVHPIKVPMAVMVAGFASINSVLSVVQSVIYGRRLREAKIEQPPIFVIGHWRSGTTFLHELFFQDERLTAPTTYECFAPHHFLLTGGFVPKLIWFLLPSRRPMDNMPVGFDLPQEDEFGLCSLGAPSPLFRCAFPNDPPPFIETLDMDVDSKTLLAWQNAIKRFISVLTVARPERLVLKSPPHTGRIGHLDEMFPGAQFVHIVRNPIKIFQSTRRLWQTLDRTQGFQIPKSNQLDSFVFEAFERMYNGFEKQRSQITANRLHEIRYEDMVADPVQQMEKLYEQMELGGFDSLRPQLEAFVAKRRDYQPNIHSGVSADLIREIKTRWANYIDRYEYGDAVEQALAAAVGDQGRSV
ncbi:MAG: sulfotransferase [Pirellulaceae bacterium]